MLGKYYKTWASTHQQGIMEQWSNEIKQIFRSPLTEFHPSTAQCYFNYDTNSLTQHKYLSNLIDSPQIST